MYSPSRGDARATAAPNARDLSSSMPIDHVPTWQREPYSSSSSRDVRVDRGDRSDRGIAGKRDWNNSCDRTTSSSSAAANVPFQRSLGLHHPANNGISLGPPNKRRTQGKFCKLADPYFVMTKQNPHSFCSFLLFHWLSTRAADA